MQESKTKKYGMFIFIGILLVFAIGATIIYKLNPGNYQDYLDFVVKPFK